MNKEIQVMAGAEPWSASGDKRGVLILHGFTGCPQSMRPLAQSFADAGFTVELPRLPGHGTTPQDMLNTVWDDYTQTVEQAYNDIASRTDTVVVAGLSMGGSLTLWLAERHPEIKAIVLVNPAAEPDDFAETEIGAGAALEAGQELLPGVAGDIADPNATELGYDTAPAKSLLSLIAALKELKPKLANIKIPALLLHSPQDHVVPPGSAKLLRDGLGGPVEYVALDKSYHVATLDYDAAEINRRAVEFGVAKSAQ